MGWGAERGYRAYMLRLRHREGAQASWRASLDEVATGESRQFASLGELFAFLVQETESIEPRLCGPGPPGDRREGKAPK